jgi:hypothetical protein
MKRLRPPPGTRGGDRGSGSGRGTCGLIGLLPFVEGLSVEFAGTVAEALAPVHEAIASVADVVGSDVVCVVLRMNDAATVRGRPREHFFGSAVGRTEKCIICEKWRRGGVEWVEEPMKCFVDEMFIVLRCFPVLEQVVFPEGLEMGGIREIRRRVIGIIKWPSSRVTDRIVSERCDKRYHCISTFLVPLS